MLRPCGVTPLPLARLAGLSGGFVLALGCAPAAVPIAAWTPPTDAFVRSDRAHLVDQVGRVMVFRGVNVRARGIFDDSLDPARCPPPTDVLEDIPELTDDDLTRMQQMGFDVIRLPIQWSAIEPTQGAFDEAYLDRVQDVVARAAAHEIRVLLDFHADGWSKDLGEDGAPLWATRPVPPMLLCGPLADTLTQRRADTLTYYTTFFDDSDPASVALQDAYGAMVAHVAARFATDSTVIGYDLFNEPIPADANIQRFYARILPALRAVDTRHLAFFEPSAIRNLTDMGPRGITAFPDPGGVYAVHLYTLSFSDPRGELDTVTRARLEPNVTRAVAEAAAFGAPLFAGEWGIRPDSAGSAPYVGIMYDLFDEHAASSTVWVWKESSQGAWGFFDYDAPAGTFRTRPAVVDAHLRIWAEIIAGEPMGATYDIATHVFELTYGGRGDDAPSVLRVPMLLGPFRVTCDGAAVADATRDAVGRVEVVCPGPGTHVVRVEPM